MRAERSRFLVMLVAGLATSGISSIAAATIQFTADYQSIPSVTSVSSVKAIDVNGDGIPDLVVVGSSQAIWYHRGLPGGGYAPPAPLVSFPGIVTLWDAGDVNNDGKIDFVAVDNTNTAWSVLGNGDGTFQAPRAILTKFSGACIRLGDLDGDGMLDLVAAAIFGPLYTLKGLGDGRFQVTSTIPPPPAFPVDIAIADFDGDSRADVMVVGSPTTTGTVTTPGTLEYFHGLPGGLLDAPVSIPMPGAPASVSVGDLDEDGLPDAMVINIRNNLPNVAAIIYGAPPGTPFGRLDLTADGARCLAAIDVDGDGHPELVACEANSYGDHVVVLGRTAPRAYAALRNYAAGPQPQSIVFTDADRDGRPDFVVANQPRSRLAILHGHGGLNFGDGEQVPTVASMQGLVVGDVSGDRIPDVVTVEGGSVQVAGIHLGVGDGTFLPISTTAGPAGCCNDEDAVLADLNSDGNLDLIGLVGSYNRIDELLGDGHGHFALAGSVSLGSAVHSSMAVGDFNGDGMPDLAVACDGGIGICLGSPSGQLGPPTFLAGPEKYVVTADLNHDGHLDLAATNSSLVYPYGSSISVWLGRGDGTFTALSGFYSGYRPTTLAVGDANGDGIPDLAIVNYGDPSITIFTGVGDGSFVAGAAFPGVWGTKVALADLDGDGVQDLIATDQDSACVIVWPGLGGGAFGAPLTFGTRSYPDIVRVADVNNDGLPDLVIGHTYKDVFDVLLNRSVSYPVPALASNVEANVHGGHVRLVWYSVSSGLYLARVERASKGAWQDVGSVRSDRANYASFEEDLPDGEYDYRLALTVGGQVELEGEVHVSVLNVASLAIEACNWSPSAGAFSASLSLEGQSSARIQIVDVSGRVVADDAWTPSAAGAQTRAVEVRARPGPGVYWARLRQHGHSVSRRIIVLE